MNWPDPADYQDAIQNPPVCFKDAELKKCSVGLTKMGLPRVAAGNFASVYEMKNGSHRWAVRCFLRQVSDQHRRYTLLSQHLAGFILPCVVGFEYIEEGILVRGQWYPIVKMEWVEGDSLTTYIGKHVRDSAELTNLARRWRGLVNSLHGNHLAHGDLQHGNVLVTPQSEMKLVDYDAMFVPSLRGERSPELGHANYQHPLREAENYDEELDNFSALVIYLSLRALAEDAGLWQLNTGENLILSASDYKEPKHSTALQRLKKSSNKIVSELASELEDCCACPVEQVPVFEELVAGTYATGPRPGPPPRPPKKTKPVKQAPPKGSKPIQPLVQPTHQLAQTATRWWAQPTPQPSQAQVVSPSGPAVATVQVPSVVTTSAKTSKLADRVNRKTIGGATGAIVVALAVGWYILSPSLVDYSSMKQGAFLAAHTSPVRGVAFSIDGKTLATTGEDGRVRFWDVDSQKPKSTNISGSDLTTSVTFSSDGKLVATGGGGIKDGSTYGEVKVWDLETGRLKWPPVRDHGDLVTCLAFSRDGGLLASGGKDLKVIIWDAQKGTALKTLRGSDAVTCLAFSPDSKLLATGSGGNRDDKRYGDVKVWDWQGGSNYKWSHHDPKDDHADVVNSVAFSPDGKTVASASDDTMIILWDTESGQRKAKLRGPSQSAKWVAFSPDGYTVVGGSADGTLRFWDVRTGQIKAPEKLDYGKAITSAAMSHDGRTIATGDKDGGLKLWVTK